MSIVAPSAPAGGYPTFPSVANKLVDQCRPTRIRTSQVVLWSAPRSSTKAHSNRVPLSGQSSVTATERQAVPRIDGRGARSPQRLRTDRHLASTFVGLGSRRRV